SQADLHIALRPGTDVVFAWAVAAELERAGAFDRQFIARHVEGFEPWMERARRHSRAEAAAICGVPESEVQRFAEWFATMSPMAMSVGNGLERNQNGGGGLRPPAPPPPPGGGKGGPGGRA